MSTSIKHVGLHDHRLQPEANNPREVAFAQEWISENNPETGSAILFSLMNRQSPDPKPGFVRDMSIYSGKHSYFHTTKIGQQEATVVATVIQWLGSNIGMCFLEAALKRCGYRIVKIEKDASST